MIGKIALIFAALIILLVAAALAAGGLLALERTHGVAFGTQSEE